MYLLWVCKEDGEVSDLIQSPDDCGSASVPFLISLTNFTFRINLSNFEGKSQLEKLLFSRTVVEQKKLSSCHLQSIVLRRQESDKKSDKRLW